jgi:hypothetical protein
VGIFKNIMSKIKETHITHYDDRAMGQIYRSIVKVHALEDGTFFMENNKGGLTQMPSGDSRNEHLLILKRLGLDTPPE